MSTNGGGRYPGVNLYGQPNGTPAVGSRESAAPFPQTRSLGRDYGSNVQDPHYPGANGVYGASYMTHYGESACGQGIPSRHQRHQSNPENLRSAAAYYGSYPPTAQAAAQSQGVPYSVSNPYMNTPPPVSHEAPRIGVYPVLGQNAVQGITYGQSPAVTPQQGAVGGSIPQGPLLHFGSLPQMDPGRSYEVSNPYEPTAQPSVQPHVPFAGLPPLHSSGNSISSVNDMEQHWGSGVYPKVSHNLGERFGSLRVGGGVSGPATPGSQVSPNESDRVLGTASSMGSSYSTQTQGGPASEVYPPYLAHQGSMDSWPLRRRALLIGCNYEDNSKQPTLQGCVEDVRNMRFFLKNKFGFREEDICVMTDDPQEGGLLPTKENILQKLDWLVEGATEGTSLVFHFAGHGIQIPCSGDDEEDGLDECIVPCDFRDSQDGIVDNVMNEKLVRPLTPGVVLHAIFDNCHSGTILDLNYRLNSKGEWLRAKTKEGNEVMGKDTSGGIAIQFGACRDNQVALDTQEMHGMVHTGAATYAFIHAVEVEQKYTYGGVLSVMVKKIREKLKGKGRSVQTPQLCCNTHQLNISRKITL